MNATLDEGLKHHHAGRLAEAEQCYRQLLAREPNHADALHLLGVVAFQVRQFEPAAELMRRAIAINPRAAIFHGNLGNVLSKLGRPDQAVECYRRAIELAPQYADAHSNLGTALREMARFSEAVAAYEQAIRINPNLLEAHVSLGTALKDQGRVEEALAAYQRAAELKPDSAEAGSNLVYVMHNSDRPTPQELFDAHAHWGRRHAEPLTREAARRAHANDRDPQRRLRVGYVSADFRHHPVARFLWPIVRHRDRERFEVICYYNGEQADDVTREYAAHVDAFHGIAGIDDARLAESIRADGIDILIDLTGHTSGGRLLTFARRPAPVQFTYLGYPDTTGVSAIDYRITDALCDPPGAEQRHAEKLARVDGCFLCYPLRDDLPPVAPLPGEGVTFASFNNLAKISPTTIRLWAAVLEETPGSRMLIKATSLGDAGTREVALAKLRAHGMPMDRVELLGPERTHGAHLATYGRVDVALDTFPYNGTTTTCEALSMGVPVVSLAGAHHAARVGSSILSAAGFGEWATEDPQRFVQIATALALDRARLAALRAEMRDTLARSVLCDGAGFARNIETIYRDAWRSWVGAHRG